MNVSVPLWGRVVPLVPTRLARHMLHHSLVALGRAGDGGPVLLWRQLRQLPDERDHVPDQLIVMGLTPRRHRTHLHAMFDDPEPLRGGAVGGPRKLRRRRIESLA